MLKGFTVTLCDSYRVLKPKRILRLGSPPSWTSFGACHLPLPPHTPHPLPYPHAHPHAPDRATPPAQVPPKPQPDVQAEGGPFTGAAGRLPCLVSLCRFRAIFDGDPRPSFGLRPGRYDLFPFFDRFNTPQRGPRTTVRSVPGRYDLSPFVDLSVAPQSQAAPASSRHRPPGKNAQHNSKQVKSPFDQGIRGECYRASSRKGRRPAAAEGAPFTRPVGRRLCRLALPAGRWGGGWPRPLV